MRYIGNNKTFQCTRLHLFKIKHFLTVSKRLKLNMNKYLQDTQSIKTK